MPTISRFYGIEIRMFFDERHAPHFHAVYAEHRALVEIASGQVLAGRLPNRIERRVLEWLAIHRTELVDNWERARAEQPLRLIAPLE